MNQKVTGTAATACKVLEPSQETVQTHIIIKTADVCSYKEMYVCMKNTRPILHKRLQTFISSRTADDPVSLQTPRTIVPMHIAGCQQQTEGMKHS